MPAFYASTRIYAGNFGVDDSFIILSFSVPGCLQLQFEVAAVWHELPANLSWARARR